MTEKVKKKRGPQTEEAKARSRQNLIAPTKAIKNASKERKTQATIKEQIEAGEATKLSLAIQQELAGRELARRKLIPFLLRHEPNYLAGWIHHDIARRLEQFVQDVADGKAPRLILSVPPRHGKSLLASQYLPAWALGNHPDWEVIISSHTATLAQKFSRRVRDLTKDPMFKVVFPDTALNPDAQSVERWETTKGGGLLAAGVGGGILGSGANILVIDDPVKNAEEAQSENTQEAIWEWYATTARTRLAPGGGVLVIMQRWAVNDLAGMLEEKGLTGEGEQFEIIRYPAIAEEDEEHRKKDEALHPERYDLSALRALENTLDPWMWSALYQQRPTIEDGDYFTKDMVQYYAHEERPESLTYYGAWDLAISKKERADWTVGFVVGVDGNDDIWIVDRYRGRWDSALIVDSMLDCWEAYRFDLMGAEEGQIKLAVGPFLEKAAEERGLYDFFLHPLKPGRRDKEMRARSIQGLMRRRRVHFPKDAPWVKELVSELLQFPNGVHDDQVDALAYLGLMLQEMAHLNIKPRSPKKKKRQWESKLADMLKKTASRAKNWRAA
jgi:predicted phage terminase large subunit-like protein